LEDSRVDPNPINAEYTAIRRAIDGRHIEVVRILLKDGRVDPAAENNRAIWAAVLHNLPDIVLMLVADHRVVRAGLTDVLAFAKREQHFICADLIMEAMRRSV
jgi:hypothetical protein